MPHLRSHLLHALAFLALAYAHVAGLQRGYLCDCGGTAHLTAVDHCHGPHDHDCAEDEDEHCPGSEHHEEGEPIHEHPANVEDVLAERGPGPQPQFSLPAQAPAMLCELAHLLALDDLAQLQLDDKPTPRAAAPPGPDWPARLAHCIALRV